ncbi:hypothetical protein N665_0624s0025 [Sinapis alba]|nr:hypothetical protein N665_0624s0025 [Sinapis alba]
MMFMAQTSHSTNIEMCVKHCIPNQCMKVAKKPDLAMCEEACKKFCDKQLDNHEEYIVPPGKDGGGTYIYPPCTNIITLRDVASAAMRLNFVVPMGASVMQHRVAIVAETVLKKWLDREANIVQGCQGYLFSGLFFS